MPDRSDDVTVIEGFDPGEIKFLIDELAYRLAELEKPMQPGDFTVPQAVAELQFRVSQLEKAAEHAHPKRLTDLETRAICVEDVIDHMQSQQITELEKRLDLLTLELHRLKAQR